MNPRRYPRTMREAFGPYTSDELAPMREPRDYSAAWWLAISLCAAAAAVVIVLSERMPA